jgi:hypothetical protein
MKKDGLIPEDAATNTKNNSNQLITVKKRKQKKGYKYFEKEEDDIIRQMVAQDKTLVDISKKLHRKNASVLYRLNLMGLKAKKTENYGDYSGQVAVENKKPQKIKKQDFVFDSLKGREHLNQALSDIVFACAKNKGTLTIAELVKILNLTFSEAQSVLIDVFNSQLNIFNAINKSGKVKWKVDRIVFQ